MTNKRIHSNGRYAKRFNTSTGDSYTLYQKDIAKGRITEQELKDFGFEPVPDVYEKCKDELCAVIIEDEGDDEDIINCLKRHFSKYVDIDD